MAFKNILKANVASATDFKYTTDGFTNFKGTELFVSDNIQHYKGSRSLKIDTPGNATNEGVLCTNLVNPNTEYTFSGYTRGIGTIRLYIWQFDSSSMIANNSSNVITLSSSSWQRPALTVTSVNATKYIQMMILTTVSIQATTINIDCLQLEQNSTATDWEFPGIDLTGNSIPANTLINNIKLENIIRAFGIESQEHIPNLTLQNILTLTGIPSEEYINNIELLNEIIIEAIENTTTVHDAVIYIKCNYMNVKFEMKYPSTSFKLKQPHTAFKMKYP